MTEPNIEDKIEEILWDMISQDHHINHMADDLNSMDTAEDRQANIDETIKQIRPLIANQVREARKLGEIEQAKRHLAWECQVGYQDQDIHITAVQNGISTLEAELDRIKELGEQMSLDDRLDSYLAQISSPIYYPIDTKQAKKAIYKDLMELIEADEPTATKGSKREYLACQDCFEIPEDHARNQLRKELREKAKKYCE